MEYKFDMQRERKRKTLKCRNDEEWAKKWQERESEWDCAVFVYIVCLYLFQSSQNSPQNVLMMVEEENPVRFHLVTITFFFAA